MEGGLGGLMLELDLACDEGCALALDEEATETTIATVLREEGVTRPCLVSVSVVGDERMRALNLEWRGQDRPTDVLSLECELPDDEGLAPGEPAELGDIVLAPAYIARQARDYGVSTEWETTLLLVHATLHLLGYDHIEEDEALAMERREDELVALITGEAPRSVELTRHTGEVAR